MNRILSKDELAPNITRYVVKAPHIAIRRKAGQFVLIRVTERGERIPLTIADADPEQGTITLVVQRVGRTTAELALRAVGDSILDVVGPLGTPTHIAHYGTAICVGGGIGIAPLHPIAQALRQAGNKVITILGARNRDLVILRQEMARASDELLICTDDGSEGRRGFVSDVLQEEIAGGCAVHLVVAIGPAVMMKVVSEITRPWGIKTLVSLNSVMVDGTGMCGGCRVEVGGEARFCCVDGPEFDGHQVNFDLLIRRQRMYRRQEQIAYARFEEQHRCRLEHVQ